MRSLSILLASLMLPACYTMKQGYYQLRLLSKREKIAEVVRDKRESPERLKLLEEVPSVIDFAKRKIGLTPGASYETYVAVEGDTLQWLVEAAEKRQLKRKSWWFPIVGEQPYLGFAKRSDAESLIESLRSENYDTKLGRVQAFSMLGYLADPLYSTMLDGNSFPELVEVLIHEMVHATIYLPGFPVFNENVATFVAAKGASAYFEAHPRDGVAASLLVEDYEKTLRAQKKFQEFLVTARTDLERFYLAVARRPELSDDRLFMRERDVFFDAMADRYQEQVASHAKGTWYESAFKKGKLNNAVVLGYSLYEARQEPFADLLSSSGGDLQRFLSRVKQCMNPVPENESELWSRMKRCGKEPE